MSDPIEETPGLPRDDDGPVFAEPWQAEAFALAACLIERGLITRDEWASTLGDEIRAAQRDGDPDLGDTYYHHWVRALARLVDDKGTISARELADRSDRWRRAYLATPHGSPVELSAAD